MIEVLKKQGLIEELEVDFKDGKRKCYLLKLSEELYDKDLIYSAAYYVIDENCTVVIDKKDNEKNKWFIYFFGNEKKLKEFFDYMINYYFYRENSKESLELKKKLIDLFFIGSRKEK